MHPYLSGYGWNGLLVEPLVDVFENGLVPTYAGNPRVTLENVALGPKEGTLPFYRVAISKAPWATALSSFHRSSIQAHIGYVRAKAVQEGIDVPDDDDDIVEVVHVRTVTVDHLLTRHSVQSVNVICIDTEGFDYEILKLVDLTRLRPEVVIFESRHLSDNDYAAALELFRCHGYWLGWEKGDTVASTFKYSWSARVAKSVQHTVRAQKKRGVYPRSRRRSPRYLLALKENRRDGKYDES